MKVFLYILLLLILFAAACRDSNSPAVSAIIDTSARQDDVVTNTKGPDTLAHMDTTKLIVDSAANITINGTSLQRNRNVVYHALYYNWLNAYTLVHSVPATLHITYLGTVMMGARGDIMDEVVRAQNDMKNYIAKDKYGKLYNALTSGQQAEMEQQYAILYQKEFR